MNGSHGSPCTSLCPIWLMITSFPRHKCNPWILCSPCKQNVHSDTDCSRNLSSEWQMVNLFASRNRQSSDLYARVSKMQLPSQSAYYSFLKYSHQVTDALSLNITFLWVSWRHLVFSSLLPLPPPPTPLLPLLTLSSDTGQPVHLLLCPPFARICYAIGRKISSLSVIYSIGWGRERVNYIEPLLVCWCLECECTENSWGELKRSRTKEPSLPLSVSSGEQGNI